MDLTRKSRAAVELGIAHQNVFVGDHIAYFYGSDSEFERAFGFLELGWHHDEHAVFFGVVEDIDRAKALLNRRGWDVDELLNAGKLSILSPAPTCEATLEKVSAHFDRIFNSGTKLIRFLGNAAVGREGWPSEEEFYKLEAAVSEASLSIPCVAICMFDLRAQPAQTIMSAAFEGHPVTFHRNCIRENPYYIPRSMAAGKSGIPPMARDVSTDLKQ